MLIMQAADSIDCNNTHEFINVAVAGPTLMPLMYLYYFYDLNKYKYLNPQSKYLYGQQFIYPWPCYTQ